MVCESLQWPCKGQEPSYTRACRHPHNLGFMSISKSMFSCRSTWYVCLKRNTDTHMHVLVLGRLFHLCYTRVHRCVMHTNIYALPDTQCTPVQHTHSLTHTHTLTHSLMLGPHFQVAFAMSKDTRCVMTTDIRQFTTHTHKHTHTHVLTHLCLAAFSR